MGQHYHHLSASGRNFIQSRLNLKRSCQWIAGAGVIAAGLACARLA
jgi:hypothetical protein